MMYSVVTTLTEGSVNLYDEKGPMAGQTASRFRVMI